jgi:hypothetical protein
MRTPASIESGHDNHASSPCSMLSGHVALIWSQDAPPGVPVRREVSLPEGTVELVLNLTDSSERGMLVCGPHSRPFIAETRGGSSLLAVHFYPGGASRFFDLPLLELHNQIVNPGIALGNHCRRSPRDPPRRAAGYAVHVARNRLTPTLLFLPDSNGANWSRPARLRPEP